MADSIGDGQSTILLLRSINQGIHKLIPTICKLFARQEAQQNVVISLLTRLVSGGSTPVGDIPEAEIFTEGQILTIQAPLQPTTEFLVFRNGQYLLPGVDFTREGQQLTLLYEIGDSVGAVPDGEVIVIVFISA